MRIYAPPGVGVIYERERERELELELRKNFVNTYNPYFCKFLQCKNFRQAQVPVPRSSPSSRSRQISFPLPSHIQALRLDLGL